ncbi:hypothetical protein [Micromonospora sp. NPDC005324]|uniref:hypothetical protein n=1 Tax=Micromonospora sp. NPDC005324 TaxID=3157033 RepID=UPI0033BFA9C9
MQAVRVALDESIDSIQADRELWRLRLTVIAHNPALLPRLVAGNSATEQAMVAARALSAATFALLQPAQRLRAMNGAWVEAEQSVRADPPTPPPPTSRRTQLRVSR